MADNKDINSVMAGWLQRGPGCVYDTVVINPGDPMEIPFFVLNDKNRMNSETNMVRSGQLPPPQALLFTKICVDLDRMSYSEWKCLGFVIADLRISVPNRRIRKPLQTYAYLDSRVHFEQWVDEPAYIAPMTQFYFSLIGSWEKLQEPLKVRVTLDGMVDTAVW